MNNLEFTAKLYGQGQFVHSVDNPQLPDGFINYHKANFAKYFVTPEEKFIGLTILETGCGPGKHAVVLALMGADVTAMDLSADNIERGKKLKEFYRLDNLDFSQQDLMRPIENQGPFDCVSAHNWMQHAENPAVVFSHLVDVLKPGGRIYFSLYHGQTFRFFITQIARRVLQRSHYDLMRELVIFYFPAGLREFNNPDDIYLENIFDDFFVPYCHTTTYETIIAQARNFGCRPITPVPDLDNIYDLDNTPLRIGFEKYEKTAAGLPLIYTQPVDEFKGPCPSYMQDTVKLAETAIEYLNTLNNPYMTCSFCLGLYRLRAMTSLREQAEKRHQLLQGYLEMTLAKSTKAISAFYDTQKLYQDRRKGEKQ